MIKNIMQENNSEEIELQQKSEEPSNENLESVNQSKNYTFKTSSLFYCFLLVFGITFTIFVFVFQIVLTPIKVIGVSMQPTINKSVISDSDEDHCDIVYYHKQNSYNLNDIVIVLNTDNKYINETENVYSLIKRIVATENQTITFYLTDETNVGLNVSNLASGRYYYDFVVKDENGQLVELDQSYIKENMYITREFYDNLMQSKNSLVFNEYERLANDYPYFVALIENLIGDDGDLDFNGNTNDDGTSVNYTIKIPKNCYFVMGDNRNESADSRYFGTVNNKDLAGKVVIHVKFGSNLWAAVFDEIKSLFMQRNLYEKNII